MESKRTATTYFIPPGKFLLVENALGNPDLIQSSVSSDCRVTIVDSANFPLDELEQFPTFRLTSADIKLKLGDGAYYIYIVVPTPDNTESTSAFISYNTALVDRDGYQVIETEDKEGNPKLEKGELLGKSGFKYYQCGVISARGGNASAITAPAGQGRLLSVDLGVNPQYANLDKKVDWDFFFSLFKPHYDDPKNPTKLTWIEAKSHMGIQGGVTMYAMDKDVDVPSLASGLPFDRRTIWYNPDTQQIEVIGGTGGGSGEGVSNFWDLSGIPSWITISKPKYSYSEIEGTPDLSEYVTQDWIISQGYASAEELKKYIPISGYTEVSGEKNFTGGLKVNGSPIYYDTEKKYWKFEGDLLVTGGVTMYGVDSTDIPSLINSLPVATTKEKGVAYFDPDFFSVSSDGKVSFIGETGGGLDITALQNYLTQNSYLNVTEGDNRYLKLSGGTINGTVWRPLIIDSTSSRGVELGLMWNGEKKVDIGWDENNGTYFYDASLKNHIGIKQSLGAYFYDGVARRSLIHSGNYSNYALPLVGGTLTNTLRIDKATYSHLILNATDSTNGQPAIAFAIGNEVKGYIGYSPNIGTYLYTTDKQYYLGIKDDGNIHYTKGTIWHSGNDGADSGLNADLLDGLNSVDFSRSFVDIGANNYKGNGLGYTYSTAAHGGACAGGFISFGDTAMYGCQINGDFGGKSLYFRGINEGSFTSWKQIAFTDSNVASATKLQKARTIWGNSFDGTSDVYGTISDTYGILPSKDSTYDIGSSSNQYRYVYASWFGAKIGGGLYLGANNGNHLYINTNGNVTIGSSNLAGTSYKLYVSGNLLATGGITTNDSVTINGIKLSKSKDGVLYLDGNLVVKGGVTMYGTDATSSPSIFDSLPIASTTTKGIAYFDSEFFSVGSDGKVSFIGKTDGFNATELQNYLTQNSYLNTTQGDGRYLKLTGGTISGTVWRPLIIDSTSSRGVELGLMWNGEKKVDIGWDENNGAYFYDASLKNHIGIKQSLGAYFYDGVARRSLIHTGNYSSYALPLVGGKLTSNSTEVLSVNSTAGADSGITFRINDTVKGWVGCDTTRGTYLYNSPSKTYLSVKNDGSLLYTKGKIWHSENDGSGSGLDADLLDGKHDGELTAQSLIETSTLNTASTIFGDSRLRTYLSHSRMTEGKPLNDGNIIHCSWSSLTNGGYESQLFLSVDTDCVQYRKATKGVWGDWKTLAFIDSNIESATKLQTARTIWGQSFNGTANVSGSLTGVTSITMSNDIFMNNNMGIGIKDTEGENLYVLLLNTNNIFRLGTTKHRVQISGNDVNITYGSSVKSGIYLDSTGNVGIYKTSPSYKLDVGGGGRFDGNLVVLETLKFTKDGWCYISTNETNGAISFNIGSSGETNSKMFLANSGNFGIGTTSPEYKLHVNGVMYGDLKMRTPRSLWGNSFDGTSNVGGKPYFTHQTKKDATSIVKETCAIVVGGDTYGYTGYNSGIGFNAIGSSSTYKDHTHAWIGLSGYVSNSDAETYNLVFATNESTTVNTAPIERMRITYDGNVGIGTTSPSYKLHVVGNTYLNGDVYVDKLNTYDIVPRANELYSCGSSGSRWYQVYSYIGNFSGAVTLGSTLSVSGATTMSNATLTGDLRLKDSTNYGRTIYFGDGSYCYLKEASDDVLTIYANAGIKLNTISTSYNVSINTNLLVSGGITMYSQRSLKNIQDDRGLSLGELEAIKPIRYTWKDNRDNRLHFGGIADDIQQVLPEVVYKTNDGVLTMDYGNAAFAIASSLIKPVVDHEKRIAMLEEENKQLRQEVERLKSA